MLEYYMLRAIEVATDDAIREKRLETNDVISDGPEIELDGGYVVTTRLTVWDALGALMVAQDQLWGMGWDTHQLRD